MKKEFKQEYIDTFGNTLEVYFEENMTAQDIINWCDYNDGYDGREEW